MRIFCTAKDSHIFSTKNNSVFVIFTVKSLTKHLLTMSLISNNRPHIIIFFFSYGMDLGGKGVTLEVVGNEPVVMVVESLAVCCKQTNVKIG